MASAVVWDFDYSLVDDNTDTWVFERQSGGEAEMEHLRARSRAGVQWTRLMDEMLARHHARGKSMDDLIAALRDIPILPEHVAAVKAVKYAFLGMKDLKSVQ